MADCYEAGVANPKGMVILSCVTSILAGVLHWFWHPMGNWTPLLVIFLWVITAVGMAGVMKGYFVKRVRQQTLYRAQDLEDLKKISWQQFEQLVADAYRARGFKVEECGGIGDGGIDLILSAPDGRRIGVQCKHWKSWQVGAPRIREFVGAVQQKRLDGGIFVASGTYSRPAIEAAAQTGIQLIDGRGLLELIRSGRAVA